MQLPVRLEELPAFLQKYQMKQRIKISCAGTKSIIARGENN